MLFLLRDSDVVNPDPGKDARGCYKRGDVVRVLPDAAHDGNLTRNPVQPPWWLLRVSGITAAQAAQYEAASQGRRRRWTVLFEGLPAATRNALSTGRFASITWTNFQPVLQDRGA